MRYVFGPVPSRRLGRSLGVNNIPAKNCSYSCVYCQLGKTKNPGIARRAFYPAEEIVRDVIEALKKLRNRVDYITFVPDGEPTLDVNVGKEARLIKAWSGKRVAILTNGSLLFMNEVRRDLLEFDLVSIKVDAVDEKAWRAVNRPCRKLSIAEVLEGVKRFADEYDGDLVTETMLIEGLNTGEEELKGVAELLAEIKPLKAYIAVPTRPCAEPWARGAREEGLLKAYNIFRGRLGDKVELLTGYEGGDFALIGDPIEAFLSIVSVHPLRMDYALKTLSKTFLNPEEELKRLAEEGEIKIFKHGKHQFIVRKLPI